MSTIYVNFHAPIMPLTVQHLMSTCGQALVQGHTEIYLMLSTPGGQVPSGLTLYNFLRALPCKLITHNIGNVDSIGNAIFLAADERKACPHSTFMFHGVGFDISGQRFEEKNLRECLDSILSDQKRIGALLVERTRIDDHQAGELFREASTKDADYALNMGIIQEKRDVTIPAGSPIATLVFN